VALAENKKSKKGTNKRVNKKQTKIKDEERSAFLAR